MPEATQTEIAQQIKSGAGDYVLALKGNQGKLFQQVEGWFDQAIARDWQGIEYSYHEKVESGHHRLRNPSNLGSASVSITAPASAESVAWPNHPSHGSQCPPIMGENYDRNSLLHQ
ncbi:MAG UNVERIFIED_CONTAM: hypothetical protein LVR29_27035 [Microcystis novacekii LVE1205-3]|jgi:hypothetical protein